ncbi:hypothetical protein D3C84_914720 [compost metagenome]
MREDDRVDIDFGVLIRATVVPDQFVHHHCRQLHLTVEVFDYLQWFLGEHEGLLRGARLDHDVV